MEREKGVGFCGLACCLCEEKEGCPGCRKGGCPEKESCLPYRCAQDRHGEGCWQCEQFPCSAPILQSVRVQAFGRYAGRFGMECLMDRLEQRERDGIAYHHPGLLTGDYDGVEKEEAVWALLERTRNPE